MSLQQLWPENLLEDRIQSAMKKYIAPFREIFGNLFQAIFSGYISYRKMKDENVRHYKSAYPVAANDP